MYLSFKKVYTLKRLEIFLPPFYKNFVPDDLAPDIVHVICIPERPAKIEFEILTAEIIDIEVFLVENRGKFP